MKIMNNNTNIKASPEDKIRLRKRISKGSYGEVWLAEWNGLKVAAKRIHQELFTRKYSQEIINHYIGELRKEWEILQRLDNPNIVRMHTVLHTAEESPVIIMELMHCNLLSYINESTSTPKVSPEKVASIALGVAKGLEYLHGLSPPVVHRDISLKNILLTEDGYPKIAGFRVAKVLTDGKEACATPLTGAFSYAAPESYQGIKNNNAKCDVKVDIFSFGGMLLAMIVGQEPVFTPLDKALEGKPYD